MDPADAIKFGIKWKGAFFLNVTAAFGWVHGSSLFQFVADAITYFMERHGFKAFAHIDDFILVTKKNEAQGTFNTLSNLFEQLGLPMNEDKRTLPTAKLTCLGITIDIYDKTFSIDPLKLKAIHGECIKVYSVTVTGKRSSSYQLSLNCNRKRQKFNLTNLIYN